MKVKEFNEKRLHTVQFQLYSYLGRQNYIERLYKNIRNSYKGKHEYVEHRGFIDVLSAYFISVTWLKTAITLSLVV